LVITEDFVINEKNVSFLRFAQQLKRQVTVQYVPETVLIVSTTC